jgi:hypothetical protein
MTRTGVGVGVGGCVLLLAVGCASTDVVGMFGLKTDGNERVVEGSLDAVAQSSRDRLVKLGLAAQVNNQGDTVYINSATHNGIRFTLVLTRERVGEKERTRIRLQWQDQRDGDMANQILVRLEHVGGS